MHTPSGRPDHGAVPTLQIHHPEDAAASSSILQSASIEETPTPGRGEGGFPRVRGYELLSVVGCGGMGIVYAARHTELNRRVAIKMLRGEALADPEFRERFRAEAEAIARLQHPNVIQVFEVGTAEPQLGATYPSPFLALEFVDGGCLTQHTHAPQESRFAARMVEALARAAHAAHSLGVVHRDLKPANVLLTRDGVPKIADFGIAKRIDADRATAGQLLTRDGTLMGTPEYMAPEQLEGETATPAIDVYALGVILYQLLTGRVPFQGATFAETMRLALRQEPVPPRRLQPGVPRDLETICLKCLEKTPGRRYESALALAEDLARWGEGRSILARPVGAAGRTLRWARRNPTTAVLSVAILLVALAGVSGIVWKWREAQEHADRAGANATRAEDASRASDAAAEKERWERYRVSVFAASSALRLHDVNAARRALDDAPEKYRDWVWNLLRAQLDKSQYVLPARSAQPSSAARFTPDGRRALLQDPDRTVRVWDTVTRTEFTLATPAEKARVFAISPDGATVAFSTDEHTIVLREVATGRDRATLRGHARLPDHLSFNADGTRLCSTALDHTARLWDTATGKQVALVRVDSEEPPVLHPSSDLRVVAAWTPTTKPRLFELETGRELCTVDQPPDANVLMVRFSPRGDRFVTVDVYPINTIRIWEIPTGRLIATLTGHENQVNSIAFSPDGKRLASGAMDRSVRIWDTKPPDPEPRPALLELHGHTGWVHHVTYSPDGSRIVSSAHDRTLRYWNAKTGKQLAVLHGHTREVHTAAYRDDSAVIASSSADGTVRLWDAREVEHDYAIRGHEKFVYSVAFHPDGVRVASSAWDGTARIWEAHSGRELRKLTHPGVRIVASVAYHPTGAKLATLARDDSLRLWDAESGQLLHRWTLPSRDWRDSRVAFSPDGDRIAAGSHDGQIRIWDVNTRAEVAVLGRHTAAVRDVAFSPDGKLLVSSGEQGDGKIRIWDLASKKQIRVLGKGGPTVYALRWNRAGTLLATGSVDGAVQLWDTATWEPIGEPLPNGTNVYGLAFTPDAKLLAVACADNLIRIWDVTNRQILAELSGHNDYVHSVAFSPDGSRLISASGDRTLRVWDTVSPAERARREATNAANRP